MINNQADSAHLTLNYTKMTPFYIPKKAGLSDKYPTKLFIIKDHNKISGHLAGIINNDISYNGQKTALIGHYECIDDIKAAETLLNTVENYFKKEKL